MYRRSHVKILAWARVSQILEKKCYANLGNVDDKNPILQLTKSRSKKEKKKKKKKEIWVEKHGFKPGSRQQD